jgi:Na+-translocating ferredoxin:NAD+ oxidoreductase subunit B
MLSFRDNPQRFSQDADYEQVKEKIGEMRPFVSIPINVDVSGKNYVLNFEAGERYLKRARRIALLDCACRKDHHNCDSPLHTCLHLDEMADMLLADKDNDRHPEEVSVERATSLLREVHDAGLVLIGYTYSEDPYRDPYDITTICACCICCCIALKPRLRYAPEEILSRYIAATDTSSCTNCGLCVDICHFGAREIVDDTFEFVGNRCLGCGLCLSTCPERAIKLAEKAL